MDLHLVAQQRLRFFACDPIADLGGFLVATLLVFLAGSVLTADSVAQAPTPATPAVISDIKLTELPQNFERWQDALGYSWQLTRQGALLSGGVPYFQGAMKLTVDGEEFDATAGSRQDGGEADAAGARVTLTGAASGVQVRRDVWFDALRGGVRYLDEFENPDAQPLQVEVKFSLVYQNPWQDLHADDGRVLGAGKDAGLRGRDSALVVKFSQAEGRHDTLLLAADEGLEKKPDLSFSENLRELSLSYQLEIPAGGRVALVHWILQRGLHSERQAGEELKPFYLRRQLVDAEIGEAVAESVMNFSVRPASAAPDPLNLTRLAKLNELLAAFGMQRGGDDVLWISRSNQLAGEVNPAIVVKVSTRLGERSAKLSDVAAIRGGGGFGRSPRVYLRDGRVWAGETLAEGLSLASRDGVKMNALKVADIEFLLLRQGVADGLPPDAAAANANAALMFVELRSGDVFVVPATPEHRLEVLSPWGADSVGFDEIVAFTHANEGAPKYRLRRSDGSRLTVFVSAVAGGRMGLPENAELPVPVAADVVGLWRSGSESLADAATDGLDEYWVEVEDVADVDDLNLPMCLLQGNNLLHAELQTEALHLIAETSVTRLVPEEIVAIRRSEISDSDSDPLFEIEMRGGDRLTGQLRERMIALKTPSQIWQVPVQHFHAYLGERPE